ncbi:MAG TPA: C25 family cysteine peptidase [Anaerolineales bacterium]|nr:C25 family cysteine peptidase [Anaerolineales bacterium]
MRRVELLQLTEAALAHNQIDYALKTIRAYLMEWPGDLAAQTLLARAYLAEGNHSRAQRLLEAVVAIDPEDSIAQRLLADALIDANPAAAEAAAANAHVIDGRGGKKGLSVPLWAISARAAYTVNLASRASGVAPRTAPHNLDSDQPLPALQHLVGLWRSKSWELAEPLAEQYAARWPKTVAFKLCLAECRMAKGAHAPAIDLLHEAAAHDMGGQVANRHLGVDHAYTALWPSQMGADVPGPLPAALVAGMGLNRLKTGAPKRTQPKTGLLGADLLDIQNQLDHIADQLGLKARKSTSDDLYLLVSSRQQLALQFGGAGQTAIDEAMRALAAAQQQLKPAILYVDDAESTQAFGLTPVDPRNAWAIKHQIAEIATSQKAKGRKIGALLIVGGPEIVPFHHLPNPTDDADADVPSDNPYATSDDNYFTPEWPVGRMPSGGGSDVGPLVRCLKRATSVHARKTAKRQLTWWEQLLQALRRLWLQGSTTRPAASFGYTANVWRRASAAVYDLIGDPAQLQSSPPTTSAQLPAEGLAPARLSYFNLHGIEDGPEWFGQRAPDDSQALPEYPVALRPADVTNHGRAPQIVFSEACYGANIFNKPTVEEALSLRFLDSGTRAVVGSTKIAYGSVGTPLIGADLLGRYFWQHLTAGLPIGEALRLAKLATAQDMIQRQGALDGEDQKTLISFVLYGDPLVVTAGKVDTSAAKEAKRRALQFTASTPEITLAETTAHETVAPQTLAEVKSLVAQYLPGMEEAEMRAARARVLPVGAKSIGSGRSTVVTLSKVIHGKRYAHPHYARATLDGQGKVIKIAISR